ncbi:CCR4-NOT transcription complex subunit 4 isoform X1 [Rhineura floridana]|uniref:CCR4-NOT transcription complex subunit 4 isoform X1 n=1 Tax=Rhineura floridana TaxID=261503 RepID=UPI002AC82C12|nr:CCR4-NOT transcription complex subunit 4 isoform X1 [Rhineura floridana]XP_061495448.1 CCR4-NOT transcription complex subunit 4 isoform X1 [Rhineura floridana]XP_061495449.1 CCR4-NOT transcription complex subunit 4 isoform X1 [Rhineura floridana]
MSRSPDAKEDPVECPLCMEPLEIDDINFFPCTCGYQICRFCWHRIRTDENGLCPACRKPYPEDPAVYKPLSQEELQRIKNEKKQKQNERKQKISENRKHLASVRVVQKNLVFVVGLSQRLADPEVLKRPEYFGKFGKIHKVVINNSTSYAGSQGPSASAYVTYIRSEDALRAIQCVNNVVVDGRTLKASLGTTKYCSYFLKNMQCPKPDCMYLHELGDEAASFTKEEMQAGKHQEYEQKLLQELYKLNPNFLQLSSNVVDKNKNKVASLQRYDVPNSNNKDAWPSLQSSSKSVNGLTMEHRKTPPILENGTDPEHMTPDGPDSDFGPIDKPSDSLSIGNCDNSQQISNSDTPSPPPGLSKSNSVIPINSSNHSARSPFEGAITESQSLFSDNFRHPNPIPSGLPPFPSSPQTSNDWPMAPEPQSLFTSETIPVSSSTDWQAAFGFGSSKQQEDDLGFDPFDITRKALADLIEKELSVQDQPSLSPTSLQNPSPHTTTAKGSGSGFLHPAAPTNANSLNSTFSVLPQRFPQFQQHRAVYNSFSFPGQAARYPWMAFPRNNIMHLNHTANPSSNSNFLDLNLPPQHSTGLGGIPIADNNSSVESLNMKEWQDGLRALLPNININFGGLPNATSPSNTNHSVPTSNTAITDSLNWDSAGSWMDPAIITGIPASAGNSLDTLQDDNPPHWLKSLQALTEMDGPSAAPTQTPHSNPFSTQIPLHRASWNPYSPPSNPTSFHSPPPGFQTAFRPPSKAPTDLLQSSALDRH